MDIFFLRREVSLFSTWNLESDCLKKDYDLKYLKSYKSTLRKNLRKLKKKSLQTVFYNL